MGNLNSKLFLLGLFSCALPLKASEILDRGRAKIIKNDIIDRQKEFGGEMTDEMNGTLTAVVIGATGAVGSDLAKQLRDDKAFKKVEVFSRRNIYFDHPKFQVHVISFDHPETWRKKVKGDVLFSCLGTTIKQAGSEKAQWKVDHDYQLEFAKAARKNGVKRYVLISSVGANKDSCIFYLRMKGTLEEDVKKLGIPNVVILQPPGLIRKNSNRLGEKLLVKVMQFMNSIGLFKNQKPMETESLASAMINIAKSDSESLKTISAQDILNYAQ